MLAGDSSKLTQTPMLVSGLAAAALLRAQGALPRWFFPAAAALLRLQGGLPRWFFRLAAAGVDSAA